MDASIQSTSKCGSSDFSIQRILSDDSRNNHDSVEAPDWLCCTRYRPPRLPRSVSSSGCRARRSGRHARVPFTAAQAAALEAAYARAPYLAPPALRALAAALQLRDDRIKIWFQNRRARERREKCINITPPLAVTLPPTAAVHGNLSSNSSWIAPKTELSTVINERLNCSANSRHTDDSESDFLNNSRMTFPLYYHSFRDANDEEKSDTSLDIESIED